MLRGEVYVVDLPSLGGSVQEGRRPVIVVQNDRGNQHSPTFIGVPVTTACKNNLPTHFIVDLNGICSIVLCEQVMTIDKKSIVLGPFYTLTYEETQRLNKCLKISLSID